jgi:hypothetical protein
MPNGHVYNFSKIGGEYNITDSQRNSYLWTACRFPSQCAGPVCLVSTQGGTTYAVGAAAGTTVTELSPSGSGISIHYPENPQTPKNSRQAVLTLSCNPVCLPRSAFC